MIEYKGYFSTVNRKNDGQYFGRVMGIETSGIEIRAVSLCQLRKNFEILIDEFLRTACPQRSFGAAIGDLESRYN